MKTNRLVGNFIVTVSSDSVRDLSMGLTKAEWEDFIQSATIAQNKRPNQFIAKLQFECSIGEILSLEINNYMKIKVKVLDVISDEGDTVYWLTSDF